MQNTYKNLSFFNLYIKIVAKATLYTSLFLFVIGSTWLMSPFFENNGLNLPIVGNSQNIKVQNMQTQAAYGQEWVSMPAGAKSAYLGIHGGTVPISLMISPNGDLIALPGYSGHDFTKILSGTAKNQASSQALSLNAQNSAIAHELESNDVISELDIYSGKDKVIPIIYHSTGQALATWVPFGFGPTLFEDVLTTANTPTFSNGDIPSFSPLENKEASSFIVPSFNVPDKDKLLIEPADKVGPNESMMIDLFSLNSKA